ncbi:hypothetical protein [Microcella alkalica]|uniref:hypothetical protein n=1 Tax=Microcella alkalica TaxID=355930 RepID=UPI00145ED38A|nr:hypothetical protein [Microcella alkalica]
MIDGMPAPSPSPTPAGPDTGPDAAPRPRRNPLAVLALVLALLLSPLAALFGHLAAGQITRSYGTERGLAMALVAAGLGWVWTLALVIAVGGVWVALQS